MKKKKINEKKIVVEKARMTKQALNNRFLII